CRENCQPFASRSADGFLRLRGRVSLGAGVFVCAVEFHERARRLRRERRYRANDDGRACHVRHPGADREKAPDPRKVAEGNIFQHASQASNVAFETHFRQLAPAGTRRSGRRRMIGAIPAPMTLAGKVVAVTGGSGQLGTAVVRAALSAGAAVASLDHAASPRDPAALKGALALGGFDLAEPDAAALALEQVVKQLGGLDALVNVAGTFRFEKVAGRGRATRD